MLHAPLSDAPARTAHQAPVAPESVGLCAARLERIDAWMGRLVAAGKLSGVSVAIMRHGELAFLKTAGMADVERGVAMTRDTIFRIYSMTKPLTIVAALMLYEEGRFQLDDPVSRYLPAFSGSRVFLGGSRGKMETAPAMRDITIKDLMTHTSGLTYGFMEANGLDALYRAEGIDFSGNPDAALGETVERLAKLPLLAQPGTRWNYSVGTDVLGYLVEVISGEPFGRFLIDRVIEPLGMVDTDFFVPAEKHHRLGSNYAPNGAGGLRVIDAAASSAYLKPRRMASGGGGLVSTADDYLRFCRFMLGKGELDGVRLLGRKTVELMTMNHLPGDMAAMGSPRFSESTYHGIGFGLGVSVMLDPAKAEIVGSPGEYAWGGAASTAFWVDPSEDMAVVLLTQLMPSSTYPIRRELRVLSYQALVD